MSVRADVAYKVILHHFSYAQLRGVGEIKGVQQGGVS